MCFNDHISKLLDIKKKRYNYGYIFLLFSLLLILSPLFFYKTTYFWMSQDEKCYFWLMNQITTNKTTMIHYPNEIFLDFTWTMPRIRGQKAITIKYPIGQSLLLSLAKIVGGEEFVFFVVPLLGLLSIAILFYLSNLLFHDVKVSLFASLILGLSPAWIVHSRGLLSDIPSAFLLLCSTVFIYKTLQNNKIKWWLMTGIFFGLSIFIRYPNFLFFIPLFIFLYLNNHYPKKISQWFSLFVPPLFILSFILFYNQRCFGSIFTSGYSAAGEFGFNLSSALGNFVNYFIMLSIAIPFGSIAVLIWCLFLSSRRELKKYSLIIISVFLFMGFYSLWNNFAQLSYRPQDLLVLGPRFMLIIFPFLSLFVVLVMKKLIRKSGLFYASAFLLIVILAFLSIFSTWKIEKRKRGYYLSNQLIKEKTQKNSLILLKNHWYKIIWPHFKDRQYLALDNNKDWLKKLEFIDKYLNSDKPVYFIEDFFIRLGVKCSYNCFDFNTFKKFLRDAGYIFRKEHTIESPFAFNVYRIEKMI